MQSLGDCTVPGLQYREVVAASLEKSFNTACQQYAAGKEQAAVANFAKSARLAISSQEIAAAGTDPSQSTGAVALSLQTLRTLYDVPDATAAIVLEDALSELLPDLCCACGLSAEAAAAGRLLIGDFTSRSNPRDVVVLFLGELASTSSLTPGQIVLVKQLPVALARLGRRHVVILQDALEGVVVLLSAASKAGRPEPLHPGLQTSASSELQDQTADRSPDVKLDPMDVLREFVGHVRAAISNWPEEPANEGKLVLAAYLLYFLGSAELICLPVHSIELPLPTAAAAHFFSATPDGLAWLGSKALKVVMESLSDLHIDGQLLLYCAEAARLGQSSENGPSREMLLRAGAALVTFCVLCENDLVTAPAGLEPIDLNSIGGLVSAMLSGGNQCQCIAASQKAFALAIAADERARQQGRPSLPLSDPGLLESLINGMALATNQLTRNCAAHAFHYALSHAKGRDALMLAQRTHAYGNPGVSAQAIQALTAAAAHYSPSKACSSGEELDQEAFFDLLLQEATDWLPPDGIGCPQDVESLCDRAEAVCAALNLLRFLLIRDSSMASNSGRVMSSETLGELGDIMVPALHGLVEATLQWLKETAEGSARCSLALAVERIDVVLQHVSQMLHTKVLEHT